MQFVAHMEKDINLIVDVDPGEADVLIQLVETLIDDTYVARASRQAHLEKLKALKDAKEAARKGAAPAATTPTAG
jgi:uncharacterized protein (UPF0147 family)